MHTMLSLWSKKWSFFEDYPHVFWPGVCLSLVLCLFTLATHQPPVSDALFYREIALGNLAQVQQPFSGRLLHPLFVFVVDRLTPLSVDQAFLLVGLALIITLSFGLCWLRKELRISLLYFILLAVTPTLFFLSRDYYLTDLAHSVVLIFFFLALTKKGATHWSTLTLLVLGFLVRESTLLLAVSIGGLMAWRREWRSVIKIFVVTAVAWVLLALLSRFSQPNIHHLPSSIYLLLKVPFNGLHNLFGITLTSNTLDANAGRAICAIAKTFTVPALSFLGGLKSVSICRPDWSYPLNTLLLMLTEFGTAPLLLIWALKNKTSDLRKSPLVIQIMLAYGLLAFCLAPLFGSSVDRLLAMGWPAFVFVVPFLYTHRTSHATRIAFLLCPLFAWVGLRLLTHMHVTFIRETIQIMGTVLVYLATYVLLLASSRAQTTAPETTLQSETSPSL